MRRDSLLRRRFRYRMYNVTAALIVINLGVYFITLMSRDQWVDWFPLMPVWQLVTYMFVHSLDSFYHIIFNMIALFFVGRHLENEMGSTEFLVFYLTCGLGAGLVSYAIGASVVGASGAVFAALLAFAASPLAHRL